MVTGGTTPYNYNIGEGNVTSPEFQNLIAGNYTLTITDAGNCSSVLPISIGGTSEINLVINNQTAANCGQENGSFTLSSSGGTAPYTYRFENSETGNPVFDNLRGGTYFVTSTDASGCSSSLEVTVPETEGPEFSIEIDQNCGDREATATINVSAGTAPFQFDIGNGLTDNPVFNDLVSGSYQVLVRDANGCELTQALEVNTSSQNPEATIADLTPATCSGGDGSFRVNISGGAAPYSYDIEGLGQQNSPDFDNISAGDYSLIVTDAGGCSTQVSLTVGSEGNLPVPDFNFSTVNLQVVLENMSQEGNSYSWDFGNGNTSDEMQPTFSFSAEGDYNVCLSVTNDCGTETICKIVSVQQENTNKELEFDYGEATGTAGNTIKVPVYVKNFREIVGFQKSVHLADTSIGKIISITDVNLDDLFPSLFNVRDHFFTVSWIDNSIEGVTVPDSTIIYQIEIELSEAEGICSDITMEEFPVVTEVAQKLGDDEVVVPAFKRKGKVCILGGEFASIRGMVFTELEEPVPGVVVSCTNTPGMTTDLSGTFDFNDLPTSTKYTITPTKTEHPLNGVTTFDLVLIQNHILGNQILDSPYKIIAADVNKNGFVSISDILELRRILLFDLNDFPNNDSWRFVASDYEFSDPDYPLKENFPENRIVELFGKIDDADFVGIKIGDVNNSVMPVGFHSSDSRNNEPFLLQTEDQYLEKGTTATISMSSDQLSEVLGFQFTMKVDPNHFEMTRLIPVSNQFTDDHFGLKYTNRGYLMCSWHKEKPDKKVEPGSLFQLEIKAHRSGWLSQILEVNSNFLQAEAYDNKGNHLNFDLHFLKPQSDIAQLELFQNQPNPFHRETIIQYQLPFQSPVELKVFDQMGKLIFRKNLEGKKGINTINLNRNDLSGGGLYYYQLQSKFGKEIKKMLVVDR
jgi:PKD repeat protein